MDLEPGGSVPRRTGHQGQCRQLSLHYRFTTGRSSVVRLCQTGLQWILLSMCGAPWNGERRQKGFDRVS
jgi:hypothetical protein